MELASQGARFSDRKGNAGVNFHTEKSRLSRPAVVFRVMLLLNTRIHRVFHLIGAPLKALSVRLDSPSRQKSSNGQNLLYG